MKVSNNTTEFGHLLEQEHLFYNQHLFDVTDTQYEIDCIALPAVVCLAVVLNILTSFTWIQVKSESTLPTFLQCLSAYDFFVAVLTFWLFSVPAVMKSHGFFPHYLNEIHPFLVPYLVAGLHMSITGSDYLNLAAAVERFLMLDGAFLNRKHTHSRTGCCKKDAYFYIVAILIFTVVFNLPLIWEQTTVHNGEHFEVQPTDLRFNSVYIKLYRLTLEFLVFKATPWFAFFILFLSLNQRVKFYLHRKRLRQLNSGQCLEVLTSRVVLGINGLFYITNSLPLYISLCHIMLFSVSDDLSRIGRVLIVLNSALKFFVYLTFSLEFRHAVSHCFHRQHRYEYQWVRDEDKGKEFLGHTRVASFVQAEVMQGKLPE